MNERPTDHPSAQIFLKPSRMNRPRVINKPSDSLRAQICPAGITLLQTNSRLPCAVRPRKWTEAGIYCCAVKSYCLGMAIVEYSPNSNRTKIALPSTAFSFRPVYEGHGDSVNHSRSHDSSNRSIVGKAAINLQILNSSNEPTKIHNISSLTSPLPSPPSPSHTSST